MSIKAGTTNKNNETHVLAVFPRLAINLQIPRKRRLEELLVLRVLEVDLLVTVGIPIWRNLDNRLELLPTQDEHPTDQRVVRLAQHADGAKEVFT